ncbi:MAG TPA: IclR family transcriptional regulator C-terminal domain-containing protein [Pseudorhizobium sp.]|nr:IclR family transcriptional regulator C-terminal domain-containing protein [Pseudorhizobium sp.]
MAVTSRPDQDETGNDASGNVPGTGLLNKSLDILQYIGETDRRLKFKDLSAKTGFSKSTLYRILAALMTRGFITMDRRDQSYILGPKFTSLAGSIGRSSELIAISSVPLKNIAEYYGENVNLAVMNGDIQQVIARWEGRGARVFASALGEIKPLYCTGLGKSLLAFQNEEVRDRLITQIEFVRYTDSTITSEDELRAEIDMIRARGFAIDDNEIIDGVRCASVPIFGPAGSAIASISTTGPAHRMTDERLRELASVIQKASRQISQDLLASRPSLSAVEGGSLFGKPMRIYDVQSFSIQAMVFDAKRRMLYWADGPGACVCRLAGGRREVVAWFDAPVFGLALASDGKVLFTVTDRAIWRVDADGTDAVPTKLMEVDLLKGVRNIVTTGSGKIVIALQNDDGSGSLVVLDSHGELKALGVDISAGAGLFEGIAQEVVHAICRTTGRIVSLDLAKSDPVPDLTPHGLSDHSKLSNVMIDSEGDVWTSRGSQWSVTCHSFDGRLKFTVPLSVPTPTALAFDPHTRSVLIGSDRVGASPNLLELAPLSGGIIALAKPA